MRAAYDALEPQTQAKLQGLTAYHSLYLSQAKIGHLVEAGTGYGFHEEDAPRRSLVKVHPITGRAALYIGRHAYGVGTADQSEVLDEERSQELLDELVPLDISRKFPEDLDFLFGNDVKHILFEPSGVIVA